eukprot:1039504-Prorocentrum_minimum.AAC.3
MIVAVLPRLSRTEHPNITTKHTRNPDSSHQTRAVDEWGTVAKGINNGKSYIRFSKVQFFRPPSIAAEYGATDGDTGLVQAVVFERWGNQRNGLPSHFAAHARPRTSAPNFPRKPTHKSAPLAPYFPRRICSLPVSSTPSVMLSARYET